MRVHPAGLLLVDCAELLTWYVEPCIGCVMCPAASSRELQYYNGKNISSCHTEHMLLSIAGNNMSCACCMFFQILLAVLARKYDWTVDLKEPVKTFPLPYPAWGLPMSFTQLADDSAGKVQKSDSLQHGTAQAAINIEASVSPLILPVNQVPC